MRTLPELVAWWDPAMLPTFEYRSLDLPAEVSGRPVTNCGAHGVPFAYHKGWAGAQVRDVWAERFEGIGLSWMVLINNGDSCLEEIDGLTPVEFLLENGVIPIIRDSMKFNIGFQSAQTVAATAPIYARYGLKPLWIAGNEPLDPREWPNNERPPRDIALAIIAKDLREAAKQIIDAGGLFGLPDGPSWSVNPFGWFVGAADRWIFDDGHGFYVGHHYGKGRDLNYPYDAATQEGRPLTVEAYRAMLDDFWLHRDWMEVWVQKRDANGNPMWNEDGTPVCDEPLTIQMSLDRINEARAGQVDPGRNAVGDDVCWRGYERVIAYAVDALGYVPPMCVGEGGWTPRDRPGSGAELDWRMPYTTLKAVAKKTVQALDEWSPFFAICPWLLGDDSMVTAGFVGWPHDAWVGWAWTPMYEYEKPVMTALRERNAQPEPGPDIQAAIAALRAADAQAIAAQQQIGVALDALS
jgi:hypothetical protein